MEYFVADTYKNFKLVGVPYEKNGKMYSNAECKCDRCVNGVYVSRVENNAIVPHPAYGGVCLKCSGAGVIRKEVRLYSEKEKASYDKAQIRKKENKAKVEAEKAKLMEQKSEENRIKWMSKNGFDENGITYVVYGENTYSIKDHLKANGFRFSPVLKWHSATKIDLPEGYEYIAVDFSEVYEWNAQMNNAFYFEEAKERVERKIAEAEGPSLSEYMGAEGERLRNLTAVYSSCRGFEGAYGYTFIYTFYHKDNCLVWFTTKELSLESGDVVDLTGTVKKHEEFRGVKTTQLSRCIIAKVE